MHQRQAGVVADDDLVGGRAHKSREEAAYFCEALQSTVVAAVGGTVGVEI